MKKKLKSLAKHNENSLSNVNLYYGNTPQLNGIACPKCGKELYDTTPMITLTSFPAQKNLHCSKCDYVGYRFV